MGDRKMKKRIQQHLICFLIILLLLCIIVILGIYSLQNRFTLQNPYNISVNPNDNFVFLGDSITEGYHLEEYYDELPVINSGVSGDTTVEILQNMKQRVYQYNPTKVFILIGTNDLAIDTDEREKDTWENIKTIIQEIKMNRSECKIYVQSIYPVNSDLEVNSVGERSNRRIQNLNKKIKKFCQKEDCTYIDMYQHLADQDGLLASKYTFDGLHLNSLGYIVVTRELLPYLNESLQ